MLHNLYNADTRATSTTLPSRSSTIQTTHSTPTYMRCSFAYYSSPLSPHAHQKNVLTFFFAHTADTLCMNLCYLPPALGICRWSPAGTKTVSRSKPKSHTHLCSLALSGVVYVVCCHRGCCRCCCHCHCIAVVCTAYIVHRTMYMSILESPKSSRRFASYMHCRFFLDYSPFTSFTHRTRPKFSYSTDGV